MIYMLSALFLMLCYVTFLDVRQKHYYLLPIDAAFLAMTLTLIVAGIARHA